MDEIEEPFPKGTVGICGCGYPLIPVLDKTGKRIGVNHPDEEGTQHHDDYFSSKNFRVKRIKPEPEETP